MPLLIHCRVSRNLRAKDGTSLTTQTDKGDFYVNHTLEAMEPGNWNPESAPNASFNELLAILQNCLAHDQGIHFAYLDDIKPDSQYGFRLQFDGEDGPHGLYVACLIASPNRSDKPIPVSINGLKVVTEKVKDIANPKACKNPSATTPSSGIAPWTISQGSNWTLPVANHSVWHWLSSPELMKPRASRSTRWRILNHQT